MAVKNWQKFAPVTWCSWLLTIGLAAVFFVPAPAAAYGGDGHRIVCQMAYDLSAPDTREKLDKIVAKVNSSAGDYQSFADLCVWADDIKSDDSFDWAKAHHYINFSRDSASLKKSDCAKNGCVLFAIEHHFNVIQRTPDNWESLAFLAHFVGDLHQPMHVSFADDLGGNRAELKFFDESSNLHWVWDSGLLQHRDGDPWQGKAEQLLAGIDDMSESLDNAPVLKWANESAAITRRIYSDYQEDMRIGESYVEQYGPILEHRMQQGAVRLARMLDSVYSSTTAAD